MRDGTGTGWQDRLKPKPPGSVMLSGGFIDLVFADETYALLVTFQKTEKEFSPSTMYADYLISRELLHWESQANTAQHHTDGQNLIHHQERGYTVLVFARGQKKRNNVTVPFTYLGPVDMVNYESERPIKVV